MSDRTLYPVILPDPSHHDQNRVAIVSLEDISHAASRPLAGHLRSATEPHSGMWAYPFSKRETAQKVLDELQAKQ